ncbi:MAG TPA: hypothetical protein VNN55_00965 [bacterium]|nr:hypothetical protein [bacterium]
MKRNRNPWQKAGRWFVGATFVAAFVASVFLLSGCGDQPTSPVSGTGADALQYVDQMHGDSFFASDAGGSAKLLNGVFRALDMLLVGAEGGMLSVDLGGLTASLDVPAAALTGDALIVMNVAQLQTPWGEATIIDFAPDGLVFGTPARLSLETSRPDGDQLRLFWWNPSTERWELQETCTVSGGQVSFSIHHFSKYGIS